MTKDEDYWRGIADRDKHTIAGLKGAGPTASDSPVEGAG